MVATVFILLLQPELNVTIQGKPCNFSTQTTWNDTTTLRFILPPLYTSTFYLLIYLWRHWGVQSSAWWSKFKSKFKSYTEKIEGPQIIVSTRGKQRTGWWRSDFVYSVSTLCNRLRIFYWKMEFGKIGELIVVNGILCSTLAFKQWSWDRDESLF